MSQAKRALAIGSAALALFLVGAILFVSAQGCLCEGSKVTITDLGAGRCYPGGDPEENWCGEESTQASSNPIIGTIKSGGGLGTWKSGDWYRVSYQAYRSVIKYGQKTIEYVWFTKWFPSDALLPFGTQAQPTPTATPKPKQCGWVLRRPCGRGQRCLPRWYWECN